MANARGHRAHSPGEDAPSFSLEDFVQDAQESALEPLDDFSWVQEAEAVSYTHLTLPTKA